MFDQEEYIGKLELEESVADEDERDFIKFENNSEQMIENLMALSACWSNGPLKICAELEDNDHINIEVTLAGVRIARGTLSAERTCIEAKAKIGVAKADLSVCANFQDREVRTSGKICVAVLGWQCAKFNAQILKW